VTVETDISRVQYATNGTTGPWSVPFYFLADADLRVVYADSDGVETALALTTDYSVTGAADPAGGAVTTSDAYAAGGTITVVRSVEALQPTDYADTDAFPAASLERNLDRLTMLAQQQAEILARAIVLPVSDETSVTIPSAAERASQILAFDASGELSLVAPTSGDATDLALSLASSSLAAKNAGQVGYSIALAYAAGTVGGKLNGFVQLDDYAGATDTLKLSAAIDAVAVSGLKLLINRSITVTASKDLPDADIKVYGLGATITCPTGSQVFKRLHRGRLFECDGLWFNGDGYAFKYDASTARVAGTFRVNSVYQIASVGTTSFTSIGASANTVGVQFTATGVGSGTGTATDVLPFAEQILEYRFRNCHFLQSAGTEAVYLSGAREGSFLSCYFETNKGAYLSYCVNPEFTDCHWKNCAQNILCDVGSEGLKVNGGTSLGSTIGLTAKQVAGVQLTGILWDYLDTPIRIQGCSNVGISNSYISVRLSSTPAVWIGKNTAVRSTNVTIQGSQFLTNYNNAAAVAMHIEGTDYCTVQGNHILNWQANGLEYDDCTFLTIQGNVVTPKSGTGTYSIACTGTDSGTVKIHQNTVGKPINRGGSPATRDIWGNQGYVTENSGEVTFNSGTGAAGVTIAHGLALAPLKGGVKLTPTSVVTTAGDWWISAVDATNITVTFDVNLGANASFAWSAQVRP